MALDSTVAFRQRAKEVGIEAADLVALERAGISTFSQLAFCCAYQPGGQDDTALFDHLARVLGSRPDNASASAYRRLFFESHALALQDLKSRLERGDSSDAKILPLAEKVQRVKDLSARLPGVILTPSIEPSHYLIDRAVQQFEDNSLRFLELHTCTSREQEILSEKTSSQLSFSSSGQIKVTKQHEVTQCAITGEIKLRMAFTHRSLAYDLARVASFEVQERWAQLLFDKLGQEPPAGYRHINVDQVIKADRALWIKVAEETRGKVTSLVGTEKSVDVSIQKWCNHPEVQFHFLPLPLPVAQTQVRAHPYQSQSSEMPRNDMPKGKGKGKQGAKSTPAGKGQKIVVPENCATKFGESLNKPICMKFNVGACRANIKHGKRCQHGYHVCWRQDCQRPCPATECTHSNWLPASVSPERRAVFVEFCAG